MTREEASDLKTAFHNVFDTPSGAVVMRFIEKVGKWYPTVYDSGETNEIIARDANRRLIGTLKTILVLNPEQIVELTKEK